MRERLNSDLVLFDPEIEKTLRDIRRQRKLAEEVTESTSTMADSTRPLCDFVLPTISRLQSGIKLPPIDANNFEIKPFTIFMFSQISFRGLSNEDPYAHVASFLEICETFKIDGATSDAVKLRCFPFTLKGRAKEWALSMPQ